MIRIGGVLVLCLSVSYSGTILAQPDSYAKTLLTPELAGWEQKVMPPPPGEWRKQMPASFVEKALPTYALRTVYVIPSNRSAQADAVQKLRFAVTEFTDWYRDQMEVNGFAPKSYSFETEADGVTPKVHIVNAPNTDTYYNVDPWSRVATAVQNAGLPVWSNRQLWLIVYEGLIMNPDGSTTGGFNGGANYGSGDDGGVGMTVGASIALITANDLVDDRPYDGMIISGWGPYPMKYGTTAAWFDGSTVSSLSSVGRGILLHETHHGLGIGHDFRNDVNFEGNVMGNGFRGMRGWVHPSRYPTDYTRLGYADALVLNVSRYFNPATSYSDNTKPTLTITSAGTVTPENGLVRVSFAAGDAAGLAVALLRLDGNTVGEMPISGSSANASFLTSYYQTSSPNSFTVAVYDVNGNRQEASVSLSVSNGFNRAPRPDVRVRPSAVITGQSIQFDCSQSADPDHSLSGVTVEWDLDGNGTYDTAPTTNKTLTTSFSEPGTRRVRARLTDPAGAQSVSTWMGLRVKANLTASEDWSLFQ